MKPIMLPAKNINCLLFLLVTVILLCLLSPAAAQRHDSLEDETTLEYMRVNPEMTQYHIRSHVLYRFATTHVRVTTVNNADEVKDAVFKHRIPENAFVSNFSIEQDGKIFDGDVVERPETRNKKRATRLNSNMPPKKINFLDRDVNIFEISVPLPPREQIQFHLVYQHLLHRRNTVYNHVIVLDPGQIVRDFMAHVTVEESRSLYKFEVPPLRHNVTDDNFSLYGEMNPDVSIHKVTGRHSEVTYRPTLRDQAVFSSTGVKAQFIVRYDVARELAAADFQFGDGYFVQYLAPSTLAPIPKNILFILDSSGTMGGTKLEQTKDAMSTILSDLRRDDRFNIISYSTWLQIWHVSGLASATATNIQRAKSFINNMRANGGANMNDALLRGVNLLRMEIAKQDRRATRTSMIFLLTDGQATSGITNTERILSGMKEANREHPRISVFAVGLGQGVDWEFLQKVSLQNSGWARRVYNAPDTALQIQECFDEISTPVLLKVRARYENNCYIPGSLTRAVYPAFYEGSEFVISGQLASNRRSDFESRVASIAVTSPMELTASGNSRRNILKRGDFPRFVERFWAYLNIKRLEDTIVSTTDNTDHILAGARIVELAQRYGWMTPFTAMEITKPEGAGRAIITLRDPGTNNSTPEIKKKQKKHNTKEASPEYGRPNSPKQHWKKKPNSAGRRNAWVDNDPHFMVMIDGISDGICFDIDGNLGDVFQLIYDPVNDITVNGLVVGKIPMTDKIKRMRTYFGKIAILSPFLNMTINPNKVKFIGKNGNGESVEQVVFWNKTEIITSTYTVNITRNKYLTMSLAQGVIVSVLRHKVRKHHPFKVDYLGLYVTDGTGLSVKTKGLIGQFQHQQGTFTKGPTLNSNDTYKAEISLTGPFRETRSAKVYLRRRKNMELQEHVACWHTAKNGTGLISGVPEEYLVPRLYLKGQSRRSIPYRATKNDVT